MSTRTTAGTSVGPLVRRVIQDTAVSLDAMSFGQHNFVFGNRSTVAQPIDIVRWASEHIPAGPNVLHIRNILVNAVYSAENKQPGAGYITLLTALELLSHEDRRVLDEKITKIKDYVKNSISSSRRARIDEAFEIMKSYDACETAYYLAERAIIDCSANASISIDVGSNTGIQKVLGYNFSSQVADLFLSSTRISNRRPLNGPRVIVIDGIVERMSEIEGVIGGSHAAREPLLIFARGYAPDVQNTLARNYSTGHLLAIPLVVPYDELGANLLGDIAIACNANPISSLKGELISSREWKDLKKIELALVSSHEVTLVNDCSEPEVKKHRAQLSKKRKTCAPAEVELLDLRLQSLMGRGTRISIGNEAGDLSGILKDRIGTHVRMFRSIGKYGIIDTSTNFTLSKFSQYRNMANRFSKLPAASIVIGVRSGISCAKSLKSLGGIVCRDS